MSFVWRKPWVRMRSFSTTLWTRIWKPLTEPRISKAPWVAAILRLLRNAKRGVIKTPAKRPSKPEQHIKPEPPAKKDFSMKSIKASFKEADCLVWTNKSRWQKGQIVSRGTRSIKVRLPSGDVIKRKPRQVKHGKWMEKIR